MEMFHPEGAGFHRMQRLPPYIFGIVNQLKMEATVLSKYHPTYIATRALKAG